MESGTFTFAGGSNMDCAFVHRNKFLGILQIEQPATLMVTSRFFTDAIFQHYSKIHANVYTTNGF